MTVKDTSLFLATAVTFILLIGPLPTSANGGTLVVFFRGLNTNATTNQANEMAFAAMSKTMPSGGRVVTPASAGGGMSSSALDQTLKDVRSSSSVVLVAYSAGYNGLGQLARAMQPQDMLKVKSIVSLEANYNGFDVAVARIKSGNPNVKVYRIGSGQCGTDHSKMTGNSCIADAIGKIAAGAQDGKVADLSGLTKGTDYIPPNIPPQTFKDTNVASFFNPNQGFLGNNLMGNMGNTGNMGNNIPFNTAYNSLPPPTGMGGTPYYPPTSFANLSSLFDPTLPTYPTTTKPIAINTNTNTNVNTISVTAGEESETASSSKDVVTLTPVSTSGSTFVPTGAPATNSSGVTGGALQSAVTNIIAEMTQILNNILKLFAR